MAETLLSPSNILLYGRVLQDLTFSFVDPSSKGPDEKTSPPQRLGGNKFLLKQLEVDKEKKEKEKGRAPRIARIYAFSFEGHYYDLAKPTLFLVHGPGKDANDERPGDRYALAPPDADHTGVAAQGYTFSDDMKVWSYDKGDFSIRLDVETGPFEEILLDMELAAGMQGTHYSGAEARIRTSGAEARIRTSGAEARIRTSGAEARSRG